MRAVKCCIFLIVFLLLCHPAPSYATAQELHQSVGLVLSGGGAKGIAHIGAIKALEENDIPIDYITGTSMGAIVGALYAIGYTPEEMMSLIESQYFGYMSTGKIDPAFTYYFSSEKPSPAMFTHQFGKTDKDEKSRFNPQSLIKPAPMMFGFMEIFGANTAQCNGDFNKLFVPFRCVSSNMTKRAKHVFAHGDLAQAVRASMSFPLIFQAIEIDGNIYYDGGIFDNFPVDVMRSEFSPDIMLGFDVSASSTGAPNSYLDQLDMLVTEPQSYDLPGDDGIKVRIDLNDFGLLDFGAAKAIYQRGYETTIAMMDSIKERVSGRMPDKVRNIRRMAFKAHTPALAFTDIEVSGGNQHQNDYIKYLFSPAKGCDTIGIERARLAFYRALASDKLNSLVPTATPVDTTGLFKLSLNASVKKKFTASAGAFITSSNNSFLYLRGGYSNLSFSSINTTIEAWIGQSYMAGAFTGEIFLPTSTPSAFRFEAVASRSRFYENEKLFFRDNEPTFVVEHEYFGRAGWTMAAGRTGAVETGVAGGRIYNSFFRNNLPDSYLAGRDRAGLNLGQAYVSYNSSTLNDVAYPTSGHFRHGAFSAIIGKSYFYDALKPENSSPDSRSEHWLRLHWRERDYFDINRHWTIGLEGELVASTRKLLQSYYASITTAPAYCPTPASNNVFDPGMRADNYLALSVVPVYKFNSSLSARVNTSAFIPYRSIVEADNGTARHGRILGTVNFFGELDVVYRLPFATLAAYCNYSSTRHHFNAGISLGLYITAPRFLQ